MTNILHSISKIMRHPWVEMTLGLIIFATGVMESGDDFLNDLSTGNFGAEHGVMLLGITHALKELPAILGGVALMLGSRQKTG